MNKNVQSVINKYLMPKYFVHVFFHSFILLFLSARYLDNYLSQGLETW